MHKLKSLFGRVMQHKHAPLAIVWTVIGVLGLLVLWALLAILKKTHAFLTQDLSGFLDRVDLGPSFTPMLESITLTAPLTPSIASSIGIVGGLALSIAFFFSAWSGVFYLPRHRQGEGVGKVISPVGYFMGLAFFVFTAVSLGYLGYRYLYYQTPGPLGTEELHAFFRGYVLALLISDYVVNTLPAMHDALMQKQSPVEKKDTDRDK